MRKGQEEIVGFVMIVVIVSIIFLILIGIFLRNSRSDYELNSADVEDFLFSAMQYTSSCQIRNSEHTDIGKVIVGCYENKICLSGEDSCKAVNRELKEMFEKSWNVAEEGYVKGFRFNANYESGELKREIMKIEQGNCNGTISGGESLMPEYPGNVRTTLKLCH